MATAVHLDDPGELLEKACVRNVAADLQFEDATQGTITARVRLLGVRDQRVYMDRPQAIGKNIRLVSGQPLQVHMLLEGTRFAFDTKVVRSACFVRLNAEQRVHGMAVAMPDEVRRQQRRADFRLSLARFDGLTAVVHPGVADDGGSCPIDSPHATVRMVNISAGGVGATCPAAHVRGWPKMGIYFMSFTLPEVESPFVTMVELRHLRKIHDGTSVVAGFKFLPWPLVRGELHGRTITRFIAAEQRRQLRRGR